MVLSVEIQDNKFNFFIELMKSLTFVKVDENQLNAIPEFQKNIVGKRLNNYLQNPNDTKEWDEVKKELENDL